MENIMMKQSVINVAAHSSDFGNKMLQSDKIDNKTKIILNYAEDQWSPLNPEGKKKYDREFLLKLQFHPLCLRKPENLPSLNHSSEISNRKSTKPLNKKFLEMKLFSPIKGDDGLHKSENAWHPSNEIDGQNSEDVLRKFRLILNQLTFQNYNTLVEQVTNLNIDTEEKLNGIVDAIIEKFIEDSLFRELPAKFCLHLAGICVPLKDKPGQAEFQQVLISRCQMEFEKEIDNELQREKTFKAIDSAEIEKHVDLLMNLKVEKRTIWKRISGIVTLISELFMLNRVSQHIVHECLRKLLSLEDEKSLECLCAILTRIGKKLDEVKENKNPDDSSTPTGLYIAQMQKIVFRRYTSEKILSKLKDVIDLKRNNWTGKR